MIKKDKPILNPITRRLYEEIYKANKTIYQVAKETGINQASLSANKHRSGGWKGIELLYKVANHLHISLEYLITGEKQHIDDDTRMSRLRDEVHYWKEKYDSLNKDMQKLKNDIRKIL